MRSDSLPVQSQIEPDACPETAREIGVRFERASGARSDGESRPSPSGDMRTRRSACDDLRGVKFGRGMRDGDSCRLVLGRGRDGRGGRCVGWATAESSARRLRLGPRQDDPCAQSGLVS